MLERLQPHGCISAASAPYRLVVAAPASIIPVIGISTILRSSCPAAYRKIETETGARSFGPQGSHHVASQNIIKYVLIQGVTQDLKVNGAKGDLDKLEI